MTRVSLTQQVHNALLNQLHPATVCIDATAGNGFDTLFLASHIGESGRVYAFDLQQQAIDNTAKKLQQAGLSNRVTLIHAGHEKMLEHIPAQQHGEVDIIMFNLGYLPSADKSIITKESTTLKALKTSIELLAPTGYISILAYPGHRGGYEETEAVKAWARKLPATSFHVQIQQPGHNPGKSPEWIQITRLLLAE